MVDRFTHGVGLLLRLLADFRRIRADFDGMLAHDRCILGRDLQFGSDLLQHLTRGRERGKDVLFRDARNFIEPAERALEREQHTEQNKRLKKHASRRDGGKGDVNPLRYLVHRTPLLSEQSRTVRCGFVVIFVRLNQQESGVFAFAGRRALVGLPSRIDRGRYFAGLLGHELLALVDKLVPLGATAVHAFLALVDVTVPRRLAAIHDVADLVSSLAASLLQILRPFAGAAQQFLPSFAARFGSIKDSDQGANSEPRKKPTESTRIIFFRHRNYLPGMKLFCWTHHGSWNDMLTQMHPSGSAAPSRSFGGLPMRMMKNGRADHQALVLQMPAPEMRVPSCAARRRVNRRGRRVERNRWAGPGSGCRERGTSPPNPLRKNGLAASPSGARRGSGLPPPGRPSLRLNRSRRGWAARHVRSVRAAAGNACSQARAYPHAAWRPAPGRAIRRHRSAGPRPSPGGPPSLLPPRGPAAGRLSQSSAGSVRHRRPHRRGSR